MASCGPAVEPTEEWPPGTILALNGEPVLEQEVDADIEAMLDIDNAFVETQRRRLVLINITLPRTYAQSLDPQRRARALASAEAWLAEGDGGPGEEDFGIEAEGNWDSIGLDVWLVARDMQPGETTGIVELPGRYAVIRLKERDDNHTRNLEVMRLCIETFPFVDDPQAPFMDFAQAKLEIVDPAWREVVPGFLKYNQHSEQ
jgi:hypothetical protein